MELKQIEPIFCVKTRDKVSGKFLFVNFAKSDDVTYPPKDKNGREIIAAFSYGPGHMDVSFHKSILTLTDNMRDYALTVKINKKFAKQRVAKHDHVRDHVIEKVLWNLEFYLNQEYAEDIGHGFDLDPKDYQILKDRIHVPTGFPFKPEEQFLHFVEMSMIRELLADANSGEGRRLIFPRLKYLPKRKTLICEVHLENIDSFKMEYNDETIRYSNGTREHEIVLPLKIKEIIQFRHDFATNRRVLFEMTLEESIQV